MDALFLPAISSVSTRAEMLPLAAALPTLKPTIPDWPGFGARPRGRATLNPDVLRRFLADLLARMDGKPLVGIAAGHAATYLVEAARVVPGRFDRLVLIAPTWRGPFPTAFGPGREQLLGRIRRAVEAPILGHAIYSLNVSTPVVGRMLREHVYAGPVAPSTIRGKLAVARQRGGRFGTAAFVTGGLDPARSREEFLDLFAGDTLPPILMLRPEAVPYRSAAEMDALAATGLVDTATIPGALLAHEEHPEAVAARINAFL